MVAGVLSPFISILENLADVNEVRTGISSRRIEQPSSFFPPTYSSNLSPPPNFPLLIFPTEKTASKGKRTRRRANILRRLSLVSSSFGREMDKNLDRGNASPFAVINRETRRYSSP